MKSASPTKSIYPHTPGILPVVEEEEGQADELDGDESEIQSTSEAMSNADEVHDLINGSSGLSAQNAVLLSMSARFIKPLLFLRETYVAQW